MLPAHTTSRRQLSYRRVFSVAMLVLCCLLLSMEVGCARQRFVSLRRVPKNPLEAPLRLLSRSGPRPTERTEQMLRRYGLTERQKKEPLAVLADLEGEIEKEPTSEKVYSYAELSYIQASRLQQQGKSQEALDYYSAAVAHAYRYLFEPGLDRFCNPYDPQFRRACDIYNASLEAVLRIANERGFLRPGQSHMVQTAGKQYQLEIAIRGPWKPEDILEFKFVNDFELAGGLTNTHHTYGLGVPLIAVHRSADSQARANKYYPPGLSFPVTAFLRCTPRSQVDEANRVQPCTLELYDPLYACQVQVGERLVPLETDLTTPLAYFLDNPDFQEAEDPTFGLLNPDAAMKRRGIYMVEPYDPRRIPVVMVHGLWSSPTTWMEMFNDLRSFPEIRSRYQFWFYQYPTGKPFLSSAAEMRDALVEVRTTLDPNRVNPNLDQMVLVGHSMGGLVSRLQTIESGDDFWRILTDRPFSELKATPQEQEKLAKLYFFNANPSIKRVVTIGTPFRGSENSTEAVRYAGQKFIKMPAAMVELTNKVIRDNPGYFTSTKLLTMATSLDSLAKDDPLFPVMLQAKHGSGTTFHNIVGNKPRTTFADRLREDGDGIVSLESARVDDVKTQIEVEADHLTVHRNPLSTLEVRRVLREHLETLYPLALEQEGPQGTVSDEQLLPASYFPPGQ